MRLSNLDTRKSLVWIAESSGDILGCNLLAMGQRLNT